MLYHTNPGQSFSAIADALHEIGVYDKALEVLPEYLDLTKPRNNALLDAITPQVIGQVTYDKREKLEKAVKKEIERVGSEELYDRWFLFVHAVGGATCMKLNLRTEMKYEPWKEAVHRAFRSRFGADAEAIFYAVNLTNTISGNTFYALIHTKNESPAVCLRAAHYTPDPVVRMFLGLFALDGLEPLAQKSILKTLFSGNTDKHAEEALALIGEAVQAPGFPTEAEEYLLTALAEASLFSAEYRKLFEKRVTIYRTIVGKAALDLSINAERIFNILDEMPLSADTPNYISLLARTVLKGNGIQGYVRNGDHLPERAAHLQRMAERCPGQYRTQMQKEENPEVCALMEQVLMTVDKSYKPSANDSAIGRAQQRCAEGMAAENQSYKAEISAYLHGETDTEVFLQLLPKLQGRKSPWGHPRVEYVKAFGMDAFAERCICFHALVNHTCGDCNHLLWAIPGAKYEEHEEQIISVLRKHGLPAEYILNACASLYLPLYGDTQKKSREKTVQVCCTFTEEVAAANTKQLCAEARCLYVEVLGREGKYGEQLKTMTDDGSKAVRALLCKYLPFEEELIRSLLTAKKGAKREMAVAMLEKQFIESLRPEIEAAFAVEKTNSVKKRLADLLGAAMPDEAKAEITGDIVTELTKGNKAKKLAWLFADPFRPVKKTDGTEAENAYLQALLLCYANADPLGRSATADGLAAALNTDDLERFTADVFARWVNAGAQAKTKWVLYFTAVHGGLPMVEALQKYIKDWSEHARGAIAAETVSALAMNGSSIALIAVDNMARKFKNKQVRSAAGMALEHAAEALGLTREELADQIVPDLGFDEQLCRTFDFGPRQFKVYLTPALELEIFEGEKRLKNLPKPGAKDDPEISAAAVKDFKEMKKQMKAAIQSQRQRLEYVLLCDRKWTAEGWRALFIRKAVMHSFAIGLIWGVYENDKLVQSFRYMEDGSFNTPDEEEYTLPEGAAIGLVHPMELDEETLAAWREQLSDYEITQPFPQLDRPVYRLTDAERKQKALHRFEGTEIANITLLGRMTKLGWDKGTPQDAGFFYEFVRTDVMRQEKKADGKTERIGYCTELKFSGMYAGGFDYTDTEDVTIEKVEICPPGKYSGWNDENPAAFCLGDVSERYISEIIAQLTTALAVAAKEEDV